MGDLIKRDEIPIPGTEFIGRQISLAQFSILTVLYRYGKDGIQGTELVIVVDELHQQLPVPNLTFDNEDITATCTQLIAKGFVARKDNYVAITDQGVNFYDTLVLITNFITEVLPEQEIIEGQQESCAVVKIS